MKRHKAIKMPGGKVYYLSPKQAEWMGKLLPKNGRCDGCRLFGVCALHDRTSRG